MTTMKYILITATMILCMDSASWADIAEPDFGNGIPTKFSLTWHTGQDPAPKRSEATWGGHDWVIERISEKRFPSKADLFTVGFVGKKSIRVEYPNGRLDETPFIAGHEDWLGGSTDVTPPYSGEIPTPPVSVLLGIGLMRCRRRN